jgi:hypothetical protein
VRNTRFDRYLKVYEACLTLLLSRRMMDHERDAWNSMCRYDQDTTLQLHSFDVAYVAAMIVLGLPAHQLPTQRVRLLFMALKAGLLHDHGKKEIDPYLIFTAEEVSPRQMEVIRSHTLLGWKSLADSQPEVRNAVGFHHAFQRGRTIPQGIDASVLEKDPTTDPSACLVHVLNCADFTASLWRPRHYRRKVNGYTPAGIRQLATHDTELVASPYMLELAVRAIEEFVAPQTQQLFG